MTIFQHILKWNNERGLIAKGFNHKNEFSYIVEELLESTLTLESKTANKVAKFLTAPIFFFTKKPLKEQILDAYCDIIVFSVGAIAKLGYDPDMAMEETLKEINDRTGKMVDGKFVKDKKPNPYKADYSKCKLTD